VDKRRVTQTLHALTTVLFRCPGLSANSDRRDTFGLRDVFFWAVFLLICAAWYEFLFVPTRSHNAQLEQQLEQRVHEVQQAEVRLGRLRQETTALREGHKEAWVRAARVQLGWLAPDEALDPGLWQREHPQWNAGVTGAERERQQRQAAIDAAMREMNRPSRRAPRRPRRRPQVAATRDE